MNTKYVVLVVWDCDADRVIWRGDYVFCKFIQSDCCKIGDEKYVSGKYSIDEIQQWSRIGVYCEKKCVLETFNFIKDGWKMYVVFPFYQSNFSTDFSREFSDLFFFICTRYKKKKIWIVYIISVYIVDDHRGLWLWFRRCVTIWKCWQWGLLFSQLEICRKVLIKFQVYREQWSKFFVQTN
jgi:hypothetical protein